MKINKNFFNRGAEQAARELLGKIIELNGKKARIVETEAYLDEKDPASRACKNGDLRETMKMEAGTILVYGVHNNWMMNFVSGKEGEAQAVLLRALEPLNFLEDSRGPGKLTKALGIDKKFHKKIIGNEIKLFDEGLSLNSEMIASSRRIGIRRDLERDMRFFVKNNKFVSR